MNIKKCLIFTGIGLATVAAGLTAAYVLHQVFGEDENGLID
ncbi:MAG: hypothetical protein ACRCUS_06210 [Anaerovoracaceae bacterium]